MNIINIKCNWCHGSGWEWQREIRSYDDHRILRKSGSVKCVMCNGTGYVKDVKFDFEDKIKWGLL